VRLEKTWWLEHRDQTEVFAEELEQALKIVAALPGAGTPYARSPVPGTVAFTSEKSPLISITRSMTTK
jgi:hypothetical protein